MGWVGAFALFLVVHAGLLGNPGYFSHDELQWGARADVSGITELPWQRWTAIEEFQYRPLTFNAWLLIAHALFDSPRLFHSLWLLLGFANVALLHACLRGVGAAPRLAMAGAAAFALNPFAVYVHGWTATLADLLWVGCGLALLALLLRLPAQAWRRPAALAALFSILALLAKEAGVALAPLLALAWLLGGRERRWAWAMLASGACTLGYLALRLQVVLFAPRPDGAYGWSLLAPPLRWAEMQLYPFLPTGLELSSVAHASAARLGLAAAVAFALWLCVWRAGTRMAAAWFIGGGLALEPTLLLHDGYPQYGYGYSALACGTLALAWPVIGRPGRVVLLLALLLSTWHGANIQREIRRIGELQARFSPSLATAIKQQGGERLRLRPQREADRGIYLRLTRDIPAYAGVAIADRVELVGPGAPADATVAPDGRVVSPSD